MHTYVIQLCLSEREKQADTQRLKVINVPSKMWNMVMFPVVQVHLRRHHTKNDNFNSYMLYKVSLNIFTLNKIEENAFYGQETRLPISNTAGK